MIQRKIKKTILKQPFKSKAKDIFNRESYIVKSEDNNIMATAMFTTQHESTYNIIAGYWLTNKNTKYGVIHRIVVSSSYRKLGIAKFVFNKCEQILKGNKITSMRIDTNKNNRDMQKLLKKARYVYC